MLEPLTLRHDHWSIDYESEAQRGIVHLRGNLDLSAVGGVARFMKDVHRAVHLEGISEFDLDVSELLFLSSSCLKSLISFLADVHKERSAFQMRILTSPRLDWQPRAFQVLVRLAPSQVRLLPKLATTPV